VSKVFAEQSVSLDGFSAGPNVAVGNGMGDGGERLHEWMFPADGSTSRSEEVRKETFGTSGAVVIGRRRFDVGATGRGCSSGWVRSKTSLNARG
jgi:hypothetical protein